MRPGERQVSETIEGVRADHVNRYKWAAAVLPKGSVVDAACGIGYGSRYLAEQGFYVRGIEIDAEAIAYANHYYAHPYIHFEHNDITEANYGLDPVVAFECIEHVPDPLLFLKRCKGLLLASVPNESVFPFRNHLYHYRHYTKAEFEDLLNEAGYKVESWFGQHGTESPVEPDVNGRTLIAIARREI